jgi:hypothetical protein
MKTTTRTSAQAEHHLTHIADQFDHWRQTRPTSAEPIPQYLWEQAIALTTTFSIARVATRLRVSGGELKKRCAAHRASRAAPASAAALGFVEVPAAPVWPRPPTAIELELHRPDGARLRIAAHEAQLPLAAMVQAFLEGAR